MSRRALAALLVAGALISGCQSEKIDVDSDSDRQGAELFAERCSGCHTLSAASSQGSKPEGQVSGGERTNGPNFDTRKESRDDVLFAIRNGGFSGAIMPANIVVGEEAEAVADFLEKYSGDDKGTGDSSNDFGSGSVGN
jgi:mono/diheme cytochrome c family protein